MPPKKEEAPKSLLNEIVFLLAGLYLLSLLLERMEAYLASKGESLNAFWRTVVDFFVNHFWPIFTAIGILVVAASVIGLVYNYLKITALVKEEKTIYGPFPDEEIAEATGEANPKNEKWERIITLINSNNPSDWRLAIIEADVLLDDLLRKMGYHGDTIGDMLKAVEPSDMLSLENAWEAHKIRNQIAHAGADYELTERDAKRTITLFESVFKEFKVI